MPSEEEVRSLVERIVDGVVDTDNEAPEVSASQSNPSESSTDLLGKIAVGADHGGYQLKERIAFRLKEAGWDVVDCGTHSQESVDYPEYALAVAQKVADGDCRWGIMIDGAGIGSSMVANKVPGVRAALCYDVSSARNSREHNHSNVLTLGAGLIGDGLAWQIVEEWLSTEWSGGRHARRVAMIDALDQQYSGPE
ncbi:MAG: ribose 5-phosphate isomerase B [Acidobacteria bacterium]|nr:ribose 5-phosphate isomerase B [Acidobacteriota bacterium]MCH8970486.1 ribose 5-phosphate isomerase B [Acidobacteriota bacterium]